MKKHLKKTIFIALIITCICSNAVFAVDSFNEEVVEVEYVDYDTFLDTSNIKNINIDESSHTRSHVKYIIKNVKNKGESLGSVLYTSNEGEPGIIVGISRSKSISATCSVSGIPIIKAVSAKLGFSVTASYSVSTSESWKVPEEHKGKEVKYGYIVARPVYDNYSYSVYMDSIHIDETFLMTGTAKKPRGRLRIEKRIVYK